MKKCVYIHIPFCVKKCAYCSFLSGINPSLTGIYTDCLIQEINYFYDKKILNTIYIGGGTPSLLKTSEVEKILAALNFNRSTEITLEVNPKTVDLKKLKELKNLGINRISLGVQAFDDKLLKIAGRIHTSDEALETIDNIKLAGFDNFSIDLIYGLPGQTLDSWQKTLNIAKNCGCAHISLYGLKIEEGTGFALNPPKELPDEDMQADMYEMALETFCDFYQYEFSNFARESKFVSHHNLTYWNLEQYYGFGLGASGFLDEKRYQNECDIKKYLKNPLAAKVFEPSSKQKLLEEYIFLGFRKCEGINIAHINKKFDIDFDKKFASQLEKFIKSGHIQKTLQGYKLTKEGIMLSNCVLCEFIT